MRSALWWTRPSHGSAVRCRGEQCRHEGQVGPITDQTAESYAATFRHECSRCDPEHEARSARHARTGSGSIINISSTYGTRRGGASVLSAASHAVEGITNSVALETAKSGNRVNGVAPVHGHRNVDPLYQNAGEQGALVTGVPMGRLASRTSLPTRSSHRVGRSFIHHRPCSHGRRRSTPPTDSGESQ